MQRRARSRCAWRPPRPSLSLVRRPHFGAALKIGDKPSLVSWFGFADQRRGLCLATSPLLTSFGRTPATHVAPPRGWLLRCSIPGLGSLLAAQGQHHHEREPQKPRKRLITNPRRGLRRPAAGVRPSTQCEKGGRCTTRTLSLNRETGSGRARSARRGRVAPPKRSLQIREFERSSGRRLAPYPSAASDGGQKMRRPSAKALPNSQINPITSQRQTHFRGAERMRGWPLAQHKPLLTRPCFAPAAKRSRRKVLLQRRGCANVVHTKLFGGFFLLLRSRTRPEQRQGSVRDLERRCLLGQVVHVRVVVVTVHPGLPRQPRAHGDVVEPDGGRRPRGIGCSFILVVAHVAR